MKYKELKITVRRGYLEELEAVLIENGYTSMQISDPLDEQDILEHPDVYKYDYVSDDLGRDPDRDPEVTLYFADDAEGAAGLGRAEEILAEFAERANTDAATEDKAAIDCRDSGGDEVSSGSAVLRGAAIEYSILDCGDDSEWLYKWQEFFKPTRVGSRIVVKPSWELYEPGPDDLVIEMDPGMAFGSGLHETTSMCIKALERVLGDDAAGSEQLRVLDVGCGTGILAIAAAMLGADECLGIDIDPDAVSVAEENIRKNRLEDRITVQYGDLTEGVDYKADIIAANLMADLVIRLSPAAAEHLQSRGAYITSGILDVKEETVCDAIMDAGFDIEEVLHDGEWCAVIARLRR